MNAFTRALDRLFAHPDFGKDAEYRPGDGSGPFACRVVLRQPDEFSDFGGTQVARPTTLLDVRAAEVARPKEGDTFWIGDAVYTVLGSPRRDADRLMWTCGCRG